MDTKTTLVLAVVCILAAALFGWRGAQPLNIQKGPRLIPWRPMMAASATGAIILIVHLVNLMGVTTGR
ncbi:MAG: hypothetical protein CFE28_02335 [Alphaproteobacteria bacterium PA2]|nr:MAG: hypothetical protein CFE28_02335 [Alphaproteobacteria bacterium PA2]